MSNKAVVGVMGFALLVAVGATGWFHFFAPAVPVPEEREENKETTGFVPQIITAKHQYKEGVHIIAGEVDLPTPCYLLESETFVEVREPDTDRVTIHFTTTGEDEICAQVITPMRFKESFSAHEDAEIIGLWNNIPVRLNLLEVGEDEDLDDFEIFIKG